MHFVSAAYHICGTRPEWSQNTNCQTCPPSCQPTAELVLKSGHEGRGFAGLGRVKMWVSEVFNHGYHSLLTPSSLSFFLFPLFFVWYFVLNVDRRPSLRCDSPVQSVLCVCQKLLCFTWAFLFLYFFLSLLSATASELREVEEKGNCQVFFCFFFKALRTACLDYYKQTKCA